MQAAARSEETAATFVMGRVVFVSGIVGALWTIGNVAVSGWSALPAVLPWLGVGLIAWFVLAGVLFVWRRDKQAAEVAAVESLMTGDIMSDEAPQAWWASAAFGFAAAAALTLGAVIVGGKFLAVLGVAFLVSSAAVPVGYYLMSWRLRKFERETEALERQTAEIVRANEDRKPTGEITDSPRDGMYCMNCGHALPLTARFCSSCGTRTDSTLSEGATE